MEQFYCNHPKIILDREKLVSLGEKSNNFQQSIVFTNGCFDILHPGHVIYLQQAKALGDILIVGLNSDESIKSLKGSQRPINCLRDRAILLAALESVDYIVPFQESSPIALLELISPDIYVKGGDYTRDTLPETPVVDAIGAKIKILPFVGNCSTTKIIEKIQKMGNL